MASIKSRCPSHGSVMSHDQEASAARNTESGGPRPLCVYTEIHPLKDPFLFRCDHICHSPSNRKTVVIVRRHSIGTSVLLVPYALVGDSLLRCSGPGGLPWGPAGPCLPRTVAFSMLPQPSLHIWVSRGLPLHFCQAAVAL